MTSDIAITQSDFLIPLEALSAKGTSCSYLIALIYSGFLLLENLPNVKFGLIKWQRGFMD